MYKGGREQSQGRVRIRKSNQNVSGKGWLISGMTSACMKVPVGESASIGGGSHIPVNDCMLCGSQLFRRAFDRNGE